jgi:hypothetical protein
LRIWPRADSAKAAGAFSWVGSAFGTNPECKPPWRTRQGHCGPPACRHDQPETGAVVGNEFAKYATGRKARMVCDQPPT